MLHEFLQYLLGEEAAGRSALYARSCSCSLCLYKSKYPIAGCVVLCVSVCAVFHTSLPLLSFWQNYLTSVGLSRLPCLHHGCASHPPPPRKSVYSHCTLCSIYILCQYNIAPFCQQKVFGNGTWESPEWRGYLPDKWPRDASDTLTLESLVHNYYTWKVTAGHN